NKATLEKRRYVRRQRRQQGGFSVTPARTRPCRRRRATNSRRTQSLWKGRGTTTATCASDDSEIPRPVGDELTTGSSRDWGTETRPRPLALLQPSRVREAFRSNGQRSCSSRTDCTFGSKSGFDLCTIAGTSAARKRSSTGRNTSRCTYRKS